MQAGVFMAVLFTASYAPLELLTGWLHDVAKFNPVTQIIDAVRQGFVGDVTWADTCPAWPRSRACLGLLFALALRGLHRVGA